MTYSKSEILTDVLVIGGGVAAVFAARRALNNGASVTLVDKGSVGRSGQTPFATGMAIFDEETEDRETWHTNMVECAEGLNNPAYLDVMMDYSKECYDEMEEWGATKPGFGNVLRSKLMELDIDIIERTMITTLLEEDGVIAGAIGFKLDREEAVIIRAKSVILCTGAGGFKPNGFQVRSLSFDGDAMAYRIGAKISGKEFVDTHVANNETPAYCWGQWSGMWDRSFGYMSETPKYTEQGVLDLSLCHNAHAGNIGGNSGMGGGQRPSGEEQQGEGQGQPPSGEEQQGEGQGQPSSGEGQQGEGQGQPSSGEGQQEGDQGQPQSGEGQQGGGPGGGEGDAPSGERPSGGMGNNPICGASAGLSVHNAEGLFPADNKCGTNITGLYAAGDCLSSMLNGPIYRGVGGFGFSGSATQGALAGEVAAEYISSKEIVSVSDSKIEEAITEMFKPLNNEQGYAPDWVEHMLQGTLIPYYVLFIKHEDRMNSALTNIEFYRDHFADKLKADDLHDLRKAHEVKNMLLNAEMKLKTSLFRTESRGNHYREDYPDSNDADWLAWVVLQKGTDGNMDLEKFFVEDFEKLVV